MSSHYRSNVRDMEFVLFELLEAAERYGRAPFGELDAEGRSECYATERLAPAFSDVDREPLSFDPETHSVRLPKDFREAAVGYMESDGWIWSLPRRPQKTRSRIRCAGV